MSEMSVAPGSDSAAAELEAHLDRLEELVAEAKTMPLSASIMVNKAEIQDLVATLREAVPSELREAQRVLRERDHILERASKQARRIIDDAEAEQSQMVSRTTVVREADREAERIVDDAEERARQLRLEAEDYVDAKLANFEVVLQKTLQAVGRGREKLQGTLHVEHLGDEEDDRERPSRDADDGDGGRPGASARDGNGRVGDERSTRDEGRRGRARELEVDVDRDLRSRGA